MCFDSSFLTRASFEENMEVLADGALWNLSEHVGHEYIQFHFVGTRQRG